MNHAQTINRNFEAFTWGALFIWWGVTELVNFLPDGIGGIGVGLILLGLNVARWMNGIPTSSFSTILGVLALVWGGLELAGSVLSLPFKLPVFAILLITLGLLFLVDEALHMKNQK